MLEHKIEISPDLTIKELLDRYPKALQIFLIMGMFCAGCPAEAFHTLAEASSNYQADVDYVIDSIKKFILNPDEQPGTATDSLRKRNFQND